MRNQNNKYLYIYIKKQITCEYHTIQMERYCLTKIKLPYIVKLLW
jgi:hypothetical protein